MGEYIAETSWQRGDQLFTDGRYRRAYQARFPGGAMLAGSASPHVVPQAYTDPAGVDPEQMFVSSISACHMLWFLSIAAKRGWRVDRYEDRAVGVMSQNERGRMAMTRVTLHPCCQFADGARPSDADLADAHHQAHESCFIANSVHTHVDIDLGHRT
jgi:organic hydroperoxide reductase OsmC/OhrA